jgi:hypothetical protein
MLIFNYFAILLMILVISSLNEKFYRAFIMKDHIVLMNIFSLICLLISSDNNYNIFAIMYR